MPNQIDQQVKKKLGVAFNANTATSNLINNAINAIDDVVNELTETDVDEDIINMEDYVEDHKRLQLFSKNFNTLEQNSLSAKINTEI